MNDDVLARNLFVVDNGNEQVDWARSFDDSSIGLLSDPSQSVPGMMPVVPAQESFRLSLIEVPFTAMINPMPEGRPSFQSEDLPDGLSSFAPLAFGKKSVSMELIVFYENPGCGEHAGQNEILLERTQALDGVGKSLGWRRVRSS